MQKRKTNLYQPGSLDAFNLSRSKIELFLECPQCFYLDRKLGIARPEIPGYTLNSAVDYLLKNEFDAFREQKKPHHLMARYGIEAVPFWHPDLPLWRDDNNKKMGASFLHRKTNFNIHGMIDDIWQSTKTDQLHIVDYKSTSTENGISLDSKYKEGYKRQMEVYQWIFKQMGFPVSRLGYFLFANARKNRLINFNGRLEFESLIISYMADDSWVEDVILHIKKCLDSDNFPEAGRDCQHCGYRRLINNETLKTQIGLI